MKFFLCSLHNECTKEVSTKDKMMTERWVRSTTLWWDALHGAAVEGAEGPGWHTKHPQPLLNPLRGVKWSPPWCEGLCNACPLLPHHTTLAPFLFCVVALPHRLVHSKTSVWPHHGLLMSGSGGNSYICLWRPWNNKSTCSLMVKTGRCQR